MATIATRPPVQFRTRVYGSATPQIATCSDSQQAHYATRRRILASGFQGAIRPDVTDCQITGCGTMQFAGTPGQAFGARRANDRSAGREMRPATTLRLARGVSDECAVVVDLPLATSVLQSVFGTSETPVFYLNRDYAANLSLAVPLQLFNCQASHHYGDSHRPKS